MPALFTIADFEDATGIEIEPEDETKVQFIIDSISEYIINYTGYNFFEVTDYEEKCQADYYGIVSLPKPVTDVTSVKDWRDLEEVSDWDWDGTSCIFNLQGHQTVVVTWSGGESDVPDDIFSVAIDMAKAALLPPGEQSMVSYQVGDVSEKYFKGRIASLIDDFQQNTLDSYRESEGTWRLGSHQFHIDPQMFRP